MDHTTVYRSVQASAPELDQRCRVHLKPTNDEGRVDETYIEVKGEWKYLYRAVDSQGNTLDFMLSAKRDARAAERFFRKAMNQLITNRRVLLMSIKTPLIPRRLTHSKPIRLCHKLPSYDLLSTSITSLNKTTDL